MAARARLVWLALLVAGAACSGSAAPNTAQRVTLYTVTARVMQAPGQPPRACAFEPLPYPPIGCGGADIRGLDLLSMFSVHRYSNGVLEAPTLRLVGTWDGHALTLTAPPVEVNTSDATPVPRCVPRGPAPPPEVPPVISRINADSAALAARGIQVLEVGECSADQAFMVLTVADRASVDYLTSRYGPLDIEGWLKPVA